MKQENLLCGSGAMKFVDYDLPMKDAYGEFVVNLLAELSEV